MSIKIKNQIIRDIMFLRKGSIKDMVLAKKRKDEDWYRYSLAMKQAYGECISLVKGAYEKEV